MRASAIYCAILTGLCLALPAHATQKFWVGPASGGVWSTDANWSNSLGDSPSTKPLANDGVSFIGFATTSTADLGAVTITNITFLAGADGSIVNGAVTINASPVTFNIDSSVNATVNASLNNTSVATLFIRNSSVGKKQSMKGVISGNPGVRIYGPGDVEFFSNSSNTYAGTTTVSLTDSFGSAGSLIVTPTVNNANLVPGDLTILSGAKLTMSFGNGIADSSIVNIDTNGLFDLNGTAETIGRLTGTGTVSLGSSVSPLVILAVGDGNNFTFGGSITGKGTVQKVGTGTMTLSGNNTFTGPINVNGGTLSLQSPVGSVAVPGDLTLLDTGNSSALKWLASDQIADTAKVTVGLNTTIDLNGFSETIGSASATGNVNLTGGKLTVAGLLTLTDNVTISGGSGSPLLTLGGDVNVTFSSASATSSINCPVVLNATRVFTVQSLGTSTLVISGLISGAGGLTKAGNGTMLIMGSQSNTYTGTTAVDKGVLQLNNPIAGVSIQGPIVIGNNVDPANSAVLQDLNNDDIASTSTILVNSSGKFDVNGKFEQCSTLSDTGSVTLGSGTLNLFGQGGTATYDGVISGTGIVTMNGTGTQIFTANNSYSGATTINNGTLLINGSQGGSAVSVGVGGTLSGIGTVGDVTSGGVLRPGGSSGGQLSCANLTFNTGSFLDINLTPGGFGKMNVTGVVMANGTLRLLPAAGFGASAGTKLQIVTNDASDVITGAFGNAAEGSILPAGTQQLKLSYIGGTGNDIVLTAQNIAPVVTSDPVATPNPAGAGQTVTFTVAATDANNDTLSFDWSFGDSTFGSGASTTHVYAAPGNYNVSVVVSDNQGAVIIKGTMVTVNSPQVGEGLDSDGDGFSDTFETAAGSDPLVAASTPTGAAISLQTLIASKISIKLNFAKPNLDSITLSGTVPVPAGFVPAGKSVVFNIGGVTQGFTLTSKGKGIVGKNTCSFGIKAGTQKYSLKLTKGSFAGALMDEGLTNKTDTGSPHGVTCSLSFNGGIFQLSKSVTYKSKFGKTGAAK